MWIFIIILTVFTTPPPSDEFLFLADRRFTDTATNRVVNAPSVRIQEPAKTNGLNPAEVSEALTNGKSKKKAYRR